MLELFGMRFGLDRMRRLMTVPGVGPVTSARFVAALDEVERFPNAASVASLMLTTEAMIAERPNKKGRTTRDIKPHYPQDCQRYRANEHDQRVGDLAPGQQNRQRVRQPARRRSA